MTHFTQQYGRQPRASAETRFEPRRESSKPQPHEQLLARAHRLLAQNVALCKWLETHTERLCAQIDELEELARQAVAVGRDDVARLALQRYCMASIELGFLQTNLGEVQVEKQLAAVIEQRLIAQIQSAQVRREEAGRATLDWSTWERSLEQAEAQAQRLQARAYASEHLAEFTSLDISLGRVAGVYQAPFEREDLHEEVERHLASLRQAKPHLPIRKSWERSHTEGA